MKTKFKKVISFLLMFTLVFLNFQGITFAETEITYGTVRVIVRNNTFKTEDGAKWDGLLLDKEVSLNSESNVLSSISDAVKSSGYSITGADTGYVTEINGLNEMDGGSMSGFNISLNDWMLNAAGTQFKTADGSLSDGDEICIEYSCAWGADIGSMWDKNDTSLSNLTFSDGVLSETFSSGVKNYTLTVGSDVDKIKVTPSAVNRNFQARIYKNEYKPENPGIKRSQYVDIQPGDKIYVGVGNSSWPTMNYGQNESVYTVTIAKDEVSNPDFDNFNISSFAVNGWDGFDKSKTEYNIDIKAYSTSAVMINSQTKFDDTKYGAELCYKDSDGNDNTIPVLSGKNTNIKSLAFGQNKVEIKIYDLNNRNNEKVYTLNINRPYDTSNQLNTNNGVAISPSGRELYPTAVNGIKEGTVNKIDENNFETYLFEDADKFTLTLKGKTNYVHIRYNAESEEAKEVASGQQTEEISFNGKDSVKINICTVSDDEYTKNGFDNASENGTFYTLNVIKSTSDIASAQIESANLNTGDIYPEFDKNKYDYEIVVGHEDELPTLGFKTSEGASVTFDNNALDNNNNQYSIDLKTGKNVVNIKNNGVENNYSFKIIRKSAYDVPDKVVDYLCLNSQYTDRAPYGNNPLGTLAGNITSLGNFGGYITYYYDNPIINDPENMYGVDFYVYGNSMGSESFAEPGTVYVSEDGNTWYQIAGSEYYEDISINNYQITYTKTADGKTAWTDNQGGSNDGKTKSGLWPQASVYYMNKLAGNDEITINASLLKAKDGSLYGNDTTSAFATYPSFGYSDVCSNGKIGADVNPYDGRKASNGFDLSLAVDENGNPAELPNGIHYIKVSTASNIWAGAFGEKSTEVGYVVRTTKSGNDVSITNDIESVIISDNSGNENEVAIENDKSTYDVSLNDSKEFTISLRGADSEDNIYVNNQKIAADGNVVINLNGSEKTVRVLVQNGEKAPVIYILHLKAEVTEKSQNIFEETTNALLDGETPLVSSVGGEWIITGLARAGKISDEFKNGYYKNLCEYIQTVGSEKLSNRKSTENSRAIIALSSLGVDAQKVNGNNLLNPLADVDYVSNQGVNGSIFALIALDTRNYNVPENDSTENKTTREILINNILSARMENGSFTLDGESPSIDITAMAIQALAPYEEYAEVINSGVEYLSNVQNDDGSFGENGTANAESTAQVVISLTSNNINPSADERFIKNGTSVYSALLNFYAGNGGFYHERISGARMKATANQMSTEQAYLAMVSYYRFCNEESRLYDMEDVDNTVIEYNSGNTENENNNDNDIENNNNGLIPSDDQSNTDPVINFMPQDTGKAITAQIVSGNNAETETSQGEALQSDNNQLKAETGKTPKTGDDNYIEYMLLFVVAAAVIVILKKKETIR